MTSQDPDILSSPARSIDEMLEKSRGVPEKKKKWLNICPDPDTEKPLAPGEEQCEGILPENKE